MNCRLVTTKMRRVGSAVLKGRRMNEESKLWEIWHWYIKGEYHCDKCPYSWEERGEEDADAGCLLFKDGELRDTCRYIRNPVSRMIVNGKLNDRDRAYDCWSDYGKEHEIYEKIQRDLFVESKEECINFSEYVYPRYCNKYDVQNLIEDIIELYKKYAHQHRTPWQKLKNAFAEWWKDFTYKHFKRYLRKRKKK